MSIRIVHVDLDAFFVEVCRQVDPALKNVDLLVIGGRRDQRGVVQSASYGARRYGIHSGMPIARAVALCPAATFHQGEFRHYRSASRAVRSILKQFSPIVVMASLDEAYLDFTGTDRMHPTSLLPVAESIRDRVHAETGLDCSVGIGPNRMVAKIASEAAKPRGLLEVRPGWQEGFLAGLPLSAIPGIGPKTAKRLAELGLSDVADVQRRSLADLEHLLGPAARGLKRRAHGHGGSTLTGGGLPKSVSRETTLSRDSTDRERLERLLTLFTTRIAGQLRGDGLMARTVTLKLRRGDFRTITRQQTLPHATDLDNELRSPVQVLFDQALAEVLRSKQGVRLIGVGASNLVPAETPDLFEEPARTKQRELTSAVDRVRERFGFDAVTPASITSMRRPKKEGKEG
ncbi:MAG: DNA polymerase IV [Gemmatimonadetes bacterium]|nr:DNA polymerase IV [Gemmatimonadota bacterium]